MAYNLEELVQRPFFYCVIDEVDSILIDEARTPLIISGQSEDSSILYKSIDKFIPLLDEDDYETETEDRARRNSYSASKSTAVYQYSCTCNLVFRYHNIFDFCNNFVN